MVGWGILLERVVVSELCVEFDASMVLTKELVIDVMKNRLLRFCEQFAM